MVGGVVLGRCQAQVGIVGQFGGAAAGAFGEVTFGQSLQPPGDAFNQPRIPTQWSAASGYLSSRARRCSLCCFAAR